MQMWTTGKEPGALPRQAANTILKGCQRASLEIKLVRFHVWKTSQEAIEGKELYKIWLGIQEHWEEM